VRTAASRLRQLASGRARRQPGAGPTTAPAAPAAGIVIDPGVIPLVMGTLRTPETSRVQDREAPAGVPRGRARFACPAVAMVQAAGASRVP
jgi:hypothetical protein